jgi:hypothetical protein
MTPLNGSSLVMVFVNPVLGPVVNVLMLETDVVDVPLDTQACRQARKSLCCG